MSLPADWWTTGLDDEPCDGCGKRPSKHAGHGSYTCESCYEARWCQRCHTDARGSGGKPHACPTPEDLEANRIRMAPGLVQCFDHTDEALALAEELTREEPHGPSWIPECDWCCSQEGTPDGERFVHRPGCKWKRLRDMFDGVAA